MLPAACSARLITLLMIMLCWMALLTRCVVCVYVQVLDSDESASSEGSPQPSTATVQDLQMQLAEALQQADHDLATAQRQHKEALAEAHAATQKLQQRCLQLQAGMADLQATSQVPCMPWVSPEHWLLHLGACRCSLPPACYKAAEARHALLLLHMTPLLIESCGEPYRAPSGSPARKSATATMVWCLALSTPTFQALS